jgi:predicted DNA-binding protein (MmcQ/YjbR family)
MPHREAATIAGMNTASVKTYCGRLPSSTMKLHAPPVNVLSYQVGGNTFAYFKTSEPERWRFSVRVDPGCFLELTSVEGIKPARYMARFHWVTIVDVRRVPPAYLRADRVVLRQGAEPVVEAEAVGDRGSAVARVRPEAAPGNPATSAASSHPTRVVRSA